MVHSNSLQVFLPNHTQRPPQPRHWVGTGQAQANAINEAFLVLPICSPKLGEYRLPSPTGSQEDLGRGLQGSVGSLSHLWKG